jgi:hypothetical protein
VDDYGEVIAMRAWFSSVVRYIERFGGSARLSVLNEIYGFVNPNGKQ